MSTTMATNKTSMSTDMATNKTSMSTNMGHSMTTMSTMMTIIGHLSDVALMVVSVVVDTLEATIGEVDRVMALTVASTIAALPLIEAGPGVAIGNIVLEGVGDPL